jgi:hypothetical protein
MIISPSIICMAIKDQIQSPTHSRVRLEITMIRRSWIMFEVAEVREGTFSWESTQHEVTLLSNQKGGVQLESTYQIGMSLGRSGYLPSSSFPLFLNFSFSFRTTPPGNSSRMQSAYSSPSLKIICGEGIPRSHLLYGARVSSEE